MAHILELIWKPDLYGIRMKDAVKLPVAAGSLCLAMSTGSCSFETVLNLRTKTCIIRISRSRALTPSCNKNVTIL